MKVKFAPFGLAAAIALAGVQPAAAGLAALVSESPWGVNQDDLNMTDVFGGSYTSYGSYAGLPASVFTADNDFVFLEGGADTDNDLNTFLGANGAAVLKWVKGGGYLLLQSAGWDSDVGFDGVTLQLTPQYNHENVCGTLTAAGQVALPTTQVGQCGGGIALDGVIGAGLTNLMIGDDTGEPIIAWKRVGAGRIVYSGLTDAEFHDGGSSLVDNMISFATASGGAVPEPASWAIMLLGFFGLGASLRARRAVIAA